eukprot:gnl/MRDRNA2_/MRDRNA2_24083_c0_seq1.p1 gnl/MRDRNA2_/MRDRNA2_24083_c0~~gnl/MRDRNA2_/MRDRNA2_24083_c0_seq1.p1  ORF type:complete len:130 (-),score=22.30 gnl/MRDRNA2_/MRDRNA2_24083_c0_seq1:46-435(-)
MGPRKQLTISNCGPRLTKWLNHCQSSAEACSGVDFIEPQGKVLPHRADVWSDEVVDLPKTAKGLRSMEHVATLGFIERDNTATSFPEVPEDEVRISPAPPRSAELSQAFKPPEFDSEFEPVIADEFLRR